VIGLVLALALIAPQQQIWTTIGGGDSCAMWTTDPRNEAVATFWIWGFFSGRNSGLNINVGRTTDGQGILEEVRLECQASPSLPIAAATMRVYERLRAENR